MMENPFATLVYYKLLEPHKNFGAEFEELKVKLKS
jgi:hypothetical protein